MHVVGACASHRDLYLDLFPSEKQDAELTLDSNAEVVVRRTPGCEISLLFYCENWQ